MTTAARSASVITGPRPARSCGHGTRADTTGRRRRSAPRRRRRRVQRDTLEHAEAIVAGAEAAARPVILQVSENAVRFHHGNVLPISAAAAAVADVAAVPVALHLDHVEDSDLLHAAAVAGFSSVMFDASRLPYDENIRATADAATWAHDQVSGLRPSWASEGQRRCTRTRRAHRPGRGRAVRRPDRSRRSCGRSGQLARDDRTQGTARPPPHRRPVRRRAGAPGAARLVRCRRRRAGPRREAWHSEGQRRHDPERGVHRRRTGTTGGRPARGSTPGSTSRRPATTSRPWRPGSFAALEAPGF
jgi:Fructose-bisphosphate aldolase class-II